MDFELQNLEMIETTSPISSGYGPHENVRNQSLILNEVQKENEELQNKVKLNYRRLLLFEAENSKLIEEKNKYFFEAQTQIEKANILAERNRELESENNGFESRLQLLNEKVYTFEKINRNQFDEIKRFSKFHLKIQNVVKPYILQLKNSLASMTKDLDFTQRELSLFKKLNEDLKQKHDDVLEQKEAESKIYQIDKNALITSYEEQIHTFSKEILDQQNHAESLNKEISRLKKAVEFKNYYENEVIKFKRIHEEDQRQLQQLADQKNQLETRMMSQDQETAQLKMDLAHIRARLDEKESILDVTRRQLAKQLDEAVLTNERLQRLEKLNNQLSREMAL